MIYPTETILEDGYPIYLGYLYVVDGEVHQSNLTGTVRDLKHTLSATEVRRCDIVERMEAERSKNAVHDTRSPADRLGDWSGKTRKKY